MKNNSTSTLCALAFCVLLAPPSQGGQTFSITLAGQYSRNLTGLSGFDNGLGGSLLFEFQPSDAFSVGIGADLIEHFGDPPFTGQALFETINLAGRYLPFAGGEPGRTHWRPFITAGVGLNPKIDIPGTYLWDGSYRISAGLGTWFHLSPQWALEIAALYNYYDSPGSPLQTLNARLGVSCFLGAASRAPASRLQAGEQATANSAALGRDSGQQVESAPKADAVDQEDKKPSETKKKTAAEEKASAGPSPAAPPAPKAPVAKTKPVDTPTPALKKAEGPAVKTTEKKAPVEDWDEEFDEEEDLDAEVPSKAVTSVKKETPAGGQLVARSLGEGPAPAPTVSSRPLNVYVFRESDTLWDIAARSDVYNDPELYPLLVNANFTARARDTTIRPGTKLVIPRGLTIKDTMSARMKAWALEYVRWRGKKINRKIYQEWVEEKEWLRLNPKGSPTIEDKSWEERSVQDPTEEP